MSHGSRDWFLSLASVLLLTSFQTLQAHRTDENGVKSAVFLSPNFVLEPGSVEYKTYYDIDFPRGHIAIKDFHAEVVDEVGNSISLHEAYIHHWIVGRYYHKKGVGNSKRNGYQGFHQSASVITRNAEICEHGFSQYFAHGSETRKTSAHVPDPYGIEVGNPKEIPGGHEEGWLLNIHTIDTRGTGDRLGCTECRCDLYNVTKDDKGIPLGPEYIGGLRCCYDKTQCRVMEGFKSPNRKLYLRYTVKWVDWDDSILPVKIYLLAITNTPKWTDQSISSNTKHDCQFEYNVDHCTERVAKGTCIDVKRVSLSIPVGGDVIYAVARQHTGGIGSNVYAQDGRVICSSRPTYGKGNEAGNEAGFIVGMSACYPQPGTVHISDGETVILESKYNSTQMHTGVIGFFYLLIAETPPKSNAQLHAPVEKKH